MAKQVNTKQKLLLLRDILMERTDDAHRMTIAQISDALAEYDIHVERKTLYDDIELLGNYGVDICKGKDKHANTYYVGSRLFETEELFVLADAVACSKFLSKSKSEKLISKIKKLTSENLSKQLERIVFIQNRVKNTDKNIYYNINAIEEGIAKKKKITFRYFEYNIDKTMSYRNGGNKYVVSPYNLEWDNENYYLCCYCEKHNNISHYRIDKMSDVSVTDEDIRLMTATQSMEIKDNRSIFSMFGGNEAVRLTIEFDNSLIGVVIDKFGKQVNITRVNDSMFSICEKVIISPPFWGWLFQLGDKAKIISPDNAVVMAKENALKLCELYK